MRVVIYGPQARTQSEAFAAGLRAHGVEPEFRDRRSYELCDLAVMWAHKSPQIIAGQRGAGRDYLVLELAYFGDRRNKFVSLGYNGLNGHAEFYNRDCPGDRWAQHGVPVAPWKQGGDYVLLMGQIPTDASLATCPGYDHWLKSAVQAARVYGLPVRFRPHPRGPVIRDAPAPIMGGELDAALRGAALVIAWNSNSLVDAVLAGVPVIACDRGSMAWPVAAHEIGAEPIRPDRTQWLHDLAYTQWTLDEIASGLAWGHLRQRYDGRPIAPPVMPQATNWRSRWRHLEVEARRQRRADRLIKRQQWLAELRAREPQ